ncbi:MBL fold metallo-hydrolase [Natronobiforma cellulositropha]|uniref:MBL fold metallo-hydrolase n=1 Tax=Natronobiforma cellulositropha TaxID=1679076 RepID=UPI0021D5E0C1|nr:MBL fold metallo-hydrolase [Natronobiforma cellulositropha]
MQVSYIHANPRTGHESYLLKFADDVSGQTACFLVDSGDGVDVDDLLGEDEYLAAVLLTHAHLDHYRTLGANVRDGAPVYTSPATARLLETVVGENAERYDLAAPSRALEALEPIDGWVDVVPDVEVRPVPAGHTPGGVGFVIRFQDGTDTHHVLASGDISLHRAGGYPAFTTTLPCTVDAMFLNVATADEYVTELTDSVATILSRAHAGSTVLVTVSGLTGLEYTEILAALGAEYPDVEPITLVGHVAKLYDDLEYDHDAVETVPVFDDPAEVVDRGGVILAGPEVPVDGSSKQLFEQLRDDPGATLVQVTGGASSPVDRATCTVYQYAPVDHPTRAELERVIDELAPIQLVIEHQQPGSTSFRSNENSFVWEHSDQVEYVIYDGDWRRPPWMTDEGERLVTQHNPRAAYGPLTSGEYDEDAMPAIGRTASADVEAEGISLERLEERLGSISGGDRPSTPDESQPEPDTPPVATGGDADDAVEPAANATLTDVCERLEALETRLGGPTLRARVVDAGDGVALLRLVEPDALETLALEHGETVSVSLASGTGAGRSTASDRDDENTDDS